MARAWPATTLRFAMSAKALPDSSRARRAAVRPTVSKSEPGSALSSASMKAELQKAAPQRGNRSSALVSASVFVGAQISSWSQGNTTLPAAFSSSCSEFATWPRRRSLRTTSTGNGALSENSRRICKVSSVEQSSPTSSSEGGDVCWARLSRRGRR